MRHFTKNIGVHHILIHTELEIVNICQLRFSGLKCESWIITVSARPFFSVMM